MAAHTRFGTSETEKVVCAYQIAPAPAQVLPGTVPHCNAVQTDVPCARSDPEVKAGKHQSVSVQASAGSLLRCSLSVRQDKEPILQ